MTPLDRLFSASSINTSCKFELRFALTARSLAFTV